MHLEVLVEEPSAEAALQELLPKILPGDATFQIHVHQGKRDLLENLSPKLRAYSKWLPDDYAVVVLVDRDNDDCHELKARLNRIARDAGLVPKTSAKRTRTYNVLNRIAIEELEAWFFGDVPAVCSAYPHVSKTLGAKAPYRDPDAIRGGTWEALERVLKHVGYFKGGMPKISVAREISNRMDPAQNRSRSFQVFRDGLYGFCRGELE